MENEEMMNVNEVSDVEVTDLPVCEDEGGIGTGLAMLIGAGLAVAVGAGVKKVKKIIDNRKANKARATLKAVKDPDNEEDIENDFPGDED